MAEPATLPGDEPNTIRSGGHEGLVYVHNPLNGEVEAVAPELAAQRVYTHGWAPVSKADAERVDAQQLLKDSVTPGEAIGQGLVRGVTGGLSDLIPGTESDERLSAAIDEKHPWLTAGAEAAGFLTPFGVGAGLSAGGAAVTGAMRGGAELGLLGKMGTRAVGMGAEGAAYGAIGAARDSKLQDDPLTAQKLLSGMFGGAIVGGGLGAGVGALEGSSSLIRGMFKNSKGAREELSAPGLRDSDISPILERAGLGPVEPGALQELQAVLYNNPNVTPEMLAAVAKSPGIKADMFVAGHEHRAMAEASFAKALNKLHDGNQDALHGWEGALKADKVRQWIGPEAEHVSDAGNLVEMLRIMDVPGRFNLSKDIVDAVKRAGKANPEAFAELMNSVSATSKEAALKNIDRALLHGNKDVLDHLFASRLLNDESIAALKAPAREIEGAAIGETTRNLEHGAVNETTGMMAGAETAQNELRQALRLAPREKLIEPAWKTAALDFVDRQNEYLSGLLAQPKGYVSGKGGAGEIKRLNELMIGARQAISEGDRANAFIELDMVKKRLAAVRAEAGERIPTGQNIRGFAGSAHEEARALLEDASIWGSKAAGAQKEMNAILHERFTHNNDFYNAFYSGAGVPDPKNAWVEKKVADPNKISSAMDRLVHPERSLELEQFKRHIAESNRLADVMEKYYSPDEALKTKIASMRSGVGEANKAMDDAMHFARRINQGKILAEAAHGSAAGAAAHIGAYVLGGPLGAAGSMLAKAMLNPGRVWRMQAVVERFLGSHSGRLAEGLAKVANKAGSAAVSAGTSSTRVLGSTAMITQNVTKRQEAYSETLQDLAAMAASAEHAIKAISSFHAPDLAHMPNAIPAMAMAIQRGAAYCLSVAPSRPKPGMFNDDELGLISDGEAEEFSNTVHAAMDPMSVFEFIDRGQLTEQVLKAAEATAPELVNEMRQDTIQFFTTTQGNVKVDDLRKQGLAVLLGIQPNPGYLIAVQESWKANQQEPTKRVSIGNMGDTGVNERYARSTYSEADRLESGEVPQ